MPRSHLRPGSAMVPKSNRPSGNRSPTVFLLGKGTLQGVYLAALAGRTEARASKSTGDNHAWGGEELELEDSVLLVKCLFCLPIH